MKNIIIKTQPKLSDGVKDKKARHNKYAQIIEAEIDLHGFTKEEAREALFDFLEKCKNSGHGRVRVVTGKGLHSKNSQGVLKGYIESLLLRADLKYSDAKICEGGSGAIDIVLPGH